MAKDEETDDEKPAIVVKTCAVFNIDKLEGVSERPAHAQQPLELAPRTQRMHDFVNGTRLDVRFGFNQACYIPSQGFIKMPAFGMSRAKQPLPGRSSTSASTRRTMRAALT